MSLFGIGAPSGPWADAGGLHAPAPVWCGLAFIALAAGVTLWLWLRRFARPRRGRGQSALPLVCPACRRAYASGTAYCAVDAQRLVTVYDGAAAVRGPGGRCPRCRRSYEPGTRFCPIDAEALVPIGRWSADAPALGSDSAEAHQHLLVGDGKICPQCAARYDLEASFCGRDGAELVTVN